MATFATLKTKVQRRVADVTVGLTAEIGDLINEARIEVMDRTNFSWMKAEVDFTTLLNTRTLGVTPADWKQWRERPYWVEDNQGQTHQMLSVRSEATAEDAVETERVGSPQYLVRGMETPTTDASSLLIYPLPNGLSDYSDGEYRVKVPYYKYLALMTADGDEDAMSLDAGLVRFIIDWACKLAYELDWNEKRASYYEGTAEKTWARMKRRNGLKVLSGINTLVPHQGADDPVIPE